MSAAETQRRSALDLGNAVRQERARQRKALVGASREVVTTALVDPTPELAGIRLYTLFAPRSGGGHGVIPRIGPKELHRAFIDLLERYPAGRQWWHPGLRLRDLTRTERQRLVDALAARAPAHWRES